MKSACKSVKGSHEDCFRLLPNRKREAKNMTPFNETNQIKKKKKTNRYPVDFL
jgi:hypothetical protein